MSSQATEIPSSSFYRWGVLSVIMMGTFMAVLDSSIVNIALPHMMSSFGVNRDQIEWVATGFMLASATVMPFMGWAASRISYKTLYLGCLLIFTLASGACALAWNYQSLIAARVMQAIGGGAIQPIGMSIVAELFEPHERGKALGVWSMGIVVAPAIGPTLGGYLTDAFGWRTIFSVNLPIGALTLLIGMVLMRPLYARGPKRLFDLVGYAFLAMALIGGLTALSNGQEKGWDSRYIHVCEAIAAVGFVMFIATELSTEEPLLDLKLFLIRNFSLSMALGIFRAIGLFGSIFLLPMFLQTIMGYTPIQSGLWMIPGAVGVGITMPIAGRLADRYSPRILTVIGCVLVGSTLLVFGLLDPLSGWAMLVVPQVVRGVGLALLMAPLVTAAINAVPRHQVPMASSFLNVSQNVGGSLGIAILNNFVTKSIHKHALRLGETFPVQGEAFHRFGAHASRLVVRHAHGILVTRSLKSMFAANQSIFRRAEALGFDNGFVLAGFILLAAVVLCLFLKPSAHHRRLTVAAEAA